ncbi:Thymidine phosphorylase [Nymphon striatum]|nr:Thymidine phosphorylase [Nymphon striatum]
MAYQIQSGAIRRAPTYGHHKLDKEQASALGWTSSIISKKTAESLSCLVLDIKFGKAALFKTEAEALELATSLVEVSCSLGTKTSAILSSMSSPIGLCIGNAIEISECLSGLHGNGHSDLMNLVYTLGGELLRLNGKVQSVEDGQKRIKEVINNGQALEKFRQMLTFQGVDADFAQKLCCKEANTKEMLKIAEKKTLLINEKCTGYIECIDGLTIATVLRKYGAGRLKSSDALKHGIGIELKAHVGEKLEKGCVWATFYHEDIDVPKTDKDLLQNALHITPEQIPVENLGRVSKIISEPQ